MATSLLEAMKEAQKKAEEKAVPQLGMTQRLQDIAQSQTGRVSERQVALSSQQEIAQVAAAQAQQQARGYASRILEEQTRQAQEEQQQRQTATDRELFDKRMNSQLEMQQRASEILDNVTAKRNELSIQRLKSNTEVAGQLLRISNAKYIDKLNAEATRNRLDNDYAFQESLRISMFYDTMDILESSFEMQAILNADKREFAEYLANFEISEDVLDALAATESRARGAMIAGGTEIAKTGIEIYRDANKPKAEVD